jgi:hypothetical protein
MPVNPNIPIPSYPTAEPTSALTYGQLTTEVAYKIGCAYYGSDGQGPPQLPINAHDLAICQNLVNKAIRKFINDGPPGGWRWLNPIAQVDLWPQISYDPTGGIYVVMQYNPTVNGTTYTGCTLLTLQTPNAPPAAGDIDTSYIPRFLQSMEYRQIWINGNPPPTTPGWWLPVDEQFTGSAIGAPFTILFWVSPTQIIVDGNATVPQVAVNANLITIGGIASGGTFTLTASINGTATSTSATIAYNASASAVQAAIQGMANIGAGNATVTGTAATGWTVSFASTLGVVYLAIGTNSLTGTQITAPFSFAAQGDYTLPANFGGEVSGPISYVANTNRGMILQWTTEFAIRSRRQNYNIESGTPYECAVRLMPTPSYQPLTNTSGLMIPRRRWELMTWRISSEFLSVIFTYTLSFNSLVNNSDTPPSPFSHDEALLSCCKALAEKEVEDSMGGVDWEYYHKIALPQSWAVDARSAPKHMGYFGNPSASAMTAATVFKNWRNDWYQRPTVPVFGTSN